MESFDKTQSNFEHHYFKDDPKLLNDLFGTTDVRSFWIADMDFEVAKPITEALTGIVKRANYAYEFINEDVFKHISAWYLKRHKLNLDEHKFLQVNGVLTGISLLIEALSKPDEKILIQTPVYHQFAHVIKAKGRMVLKSSLKLKEGRYSMDLELLRKQFRDEEVKLMILCNPHNPVGRVWAKEEIRSLVDLASKYQVRIISDEIHSDIIYTGNSFNSIMSVDNSEHIALIGSPAKTFGMQSIAAGYMYIPDEELREKMKKQIEALYLHHGNVLTSYASIAAYSEGQNWLDELISRLELNIGWIEDFLKTELPQVRLIKPEGTYQIWLDFNSLNMEDKELHKFLIEEAKLALAPGYWFGKDTKGFMRMSIASELSVIQDAFESLKKVIAARNNKI